MAGNRFLDQFRDMLENFDRCKEADLHDTILLKNEKVRVPAPTLPLQIQLGGEMGKRLFLYPETKLDKNGSPSGTGSYLLFDPDQYFTSISGFVRVTPGDSLILGRQDSDQAELLVYPQQVAKRHLNIKLSTKKLKFTDNSPEQGSCIAPLTNDQLARKLTDLRLDNIARFNRLMPTPLRLLEPAEACDLLDSVVDIMQRDTRQIMATDGKPGGLVILPDDIHTFFIGDIHARIDNLLVILTQNHFLEAMEKGSAALVILGDAVHPDETGREHEMESSMFIMDIILALKKRFPEAVYYLRGNHDSFSEEISKRSVPQGLLWKKALHKTRGTEYVASMNRFYETSPYLALSQNFLACHAGAPTSKVSIEKLVNIRKHPKLEQQLTSIRARKPKALSGYDGSDVKRFRKQLNLEPETPLLVGHTPLSEHDTLWPNANDIPNHHVLFGAHSDWVGVVVQTGDRLLPLRYPAEPMLELINQAKKGSNSA